MNTIEGNRLIAEFMGFNFDSNKKDGLPFYKQVNRGGWESRNFYNPKYDTSWDWLMLVVEKINTIDDYSYDVIIFRSDCHINDREQILFESSILTKKDTIIEVVWGCVVNFIQWYNSNKAPEGGKKEGK